MTIDPDQWSRVKLLIQAALDRKPEERTPFLDHACGDDSALRAEVDSLLAAHDAAGDFAERPAIHAFTLSTPGDVGSSPDSGNSALKPGDRLGPYEILEWISSGGMGDVYRAHDGRLDRVVAIKTLPPQIAGDPDLRSRFAREAMMLATVSHPHICPVFDVGQHDDIDFIVMEFLEGETLAGRIAKGRLPMDQALRYGVEIADALDKAHRHGVVHRDLKPANIMLTKTGSKLLDFGLAKRDAPGRTANGGIDRPATRRLSDPGTMLGTPNYMAPEQLEGLDADARADIFAFGAVLCEMLTGRKALHDTTTASTPRSPTTAAIDRLIAACMSSDPEARWQNAGDLARELEWIRQDTAKAGDGATGPLVATTGRIRHPRSAAAIAGIIIGAAATALLVPSLTSGPRGQSRDIERVLLGISPADQLHAATDTPAEQGQLSRIAIALEPDGRTLVFSAVRANRQQLFARALDQLDAAPIPGTDGATNPFLSPDRQWVGFWANGALKKVPVSGGAPTTLCETTPVFGASWGSNDVILFARETGGLWQVPANGGSPTPVTAVDEKSGEVSHRLPHFLPGNQAVIFTVTRTLLPTWEDTQIVAQSFTTGARKVLIEGGADARYVPTGHLVYMRRATLMAVPFNPRDLSVSGGSVALQTDVMQAANMTHTSRDSGAGQFSISASGSLAYVQGSVYSLPDRSLVWIDQSGHVEPLGAPPRAYTYPRLSPDGTRVLVSTQGDRSIWIYDLARATSTRVNAEGRSQAAIWTSDGARITFGSSPSGTENLFWMPADGTSKAEPLTSSALFHRASAWSPDDQVLAFVAQNVQPDHYSILTLRNGKGPPAHLMPSRFNQSHPEFSPDGHWLAFASDESGRSEIYVQPYPGPGAKMMISSEGGTAPAWAKNGKEIFYLAPALSAGKAGLRMMSVSITLGSRLTAGRPRALFESSLMGPGAPIRNYDVANDGRFLAIQQLESSPIKPTQIVLVQNWLEELKGRVPTK